ncbi:related to Alcohol dehydrogenase [Armillaria ostoyae]|uniref:Related to Alcohol dehydrogenase n=1 Tax=Armillaria ostoyae TaxID=47428 RepID=A0A284RWZ1_ARMOS|nr:related to Alcohol dehydrogenase [Armillaria ostoyae]
MAPQIPKTTRSYYFPALGSYTNLTLQTASIPSIKATHVLVKVHAVSLQYRDLIIASNNYPATIEPDNLVPCSDMAGEVVAIDGDIDADIINTALGAGQQGVLTEYRTFNDYSLVKIPDHLSYEEASTLPCAGLTAYNALMGPRPVKAGDSVLVLGTGGVSIFGLQLAVASGATVIATSSSDAKLAIAKKLGATHTINYNTTPDWDKEVLRLTDGRGVDHILEAHSESTRPVIDKVFSFEEAIDAYAHLESQKHVGKVVIRVVPA